MSLKTIYQQFYPSQRPTFTPSSLAPGSQIGKVFLITGGSSGIGKELAKALYPTGATIYLASRSESRIASAIADIESAFPSSSTPSSKGNLKPLPGLDLGDFTTIKPAFDRFAAQEKVLHRIWNNAAQARKPGSTSAQGLEPHIASNAVGPYFLTTLLLPHLRAGAESSGEPSRIIWTGSVQIEMSSPKGGIDFARLAGGETIQQDTDYAASKVGNLFLAHEFAKRHPDIISVCQNPGNLDTAIYDGENRLLVWVLRWVVLYEAWYGACTMLFAGFSEEISQARNGCYVWPWGVVRENSRVDVYAAIGEGKAGEFWEWCEDRVREYR